MVITKEQLLSDRSKVKLKVLANGGFGVGKTFFSMTFPKFAYAQIEPNGLTTALSNPALIENMVVADQFILSQDEDVKATFTRLEQFCRDMREKAKKGEIETFILDNLTHLSVNRWAYIEKYEKTVSPKTGNVDTQSMFGNLSRWLYRFILTEVVSLPCHVVVNCHEQDEEVEDSDGKLAKTGRIISQTLGGFRNQAASLFNASIFLESKKVGTDKYQYTARCKPSGGKAAKNNVGLPETVESISYEAIIKSLYQPTATTTKEAK
jgi:hypothetical protein